MNLRPNVFLALLCYLMAFGCTSPEKSKVHVQGEIKNLGHSSLCISYYNENKDLAYDTIFSNGSGKFDFKINTYDKITPVTIYFSEKKCWTTLFAKSGDHVRIRGNIQLVDLLNISGGIVNDDLSRYKKQIKPLYMERLAILNGKYYTVEESEERLAAINLLLKRAAKEYIKENPASIASVVLIQDFFYQDYDPVTKDLLNILEGDAKNSHLTERIREGIQDW
ncbi:MAG: hypothetical protein ABFC90_06105 [Bacteroidales bacterium]|nr:DUF4369 domain-containing protein [Bacteroidales bacterium]